MEPVFTLGETIRIRHKLGYVIRVFNTKWGFVYEIRLAFEPEKLTAGFEEDIKKASNREMKNDCKHHELHRA